MKEINLDNKKGGKMKTHLFCLISSMLLVVNFSYAASKITISNKAFVTKVIQKENGTMIKKLEPAKRVTPGELITYEISYKNPGAEPASNLVIKNPIPKSTVYHSAEGKFEVSVDGGKSFGILKKLKVSENGKLRAALNKDVTHVLWKLNKPLQPYAEGKVKFITRLL